jgi:hypothetical protein
MRHVRNIAIILALAFVVAAVPGGGNAGEAVLATISIAFLVVIGLLGFQLYRSQSLTLMSFTDGRRALLFGSFGLIVLMIAGADEMLETGLGALIWIGLMAAAAITIWRLYLESQTY